MITFKYTTPPPVFANQDRSDLAIEFHLDETGEARITEVMQAFKQFLLAIGYSAELVNQELPE